MTEELLGCPLCGNAYDPRVVQLEMTILIDGEWVSQWRCSRCKEWVRLTPIKRSD